MNLNPNLNFSEIIIRYAVLMCIGIVAGVFQSFFLIIPAMAVFLTAVLGWSPIKAYRSSHRRVAH